jgi:RHS repeat-associated protein
LSHYQSFDYDEVGQLITADDNGVTTRYNSDGGGYLSDPYGLVRNVITEGFGGSFSTEYGYDIALRMNSVNYSDNQTTNYLYNNLGQLEQIPYYIDQMNYNIAGLLSSYTMANDVQATFAYDENYRLSSMIYTNQLGELKSYSYQYDMDDNIIYQNGDYYSYDRLGRLQSAMITGDAGLTEWQPAQSQQSYGVVQEDVLGDKPIELTTDDAQISTDSESVVIDAGFGYAFKRIYLPVTSINENLVNEQTLQVFIAQYNGEESWERVYNADINIQTDGVTITLPNATFGRYIKIHSTVHRLNADGLPVRLETILDVDTDGIIITAVAGGRNEFYRYSSDGNRTGRSILAGEMSSEDYQYYSDSDLLKLNGEYAYRYDENGNLIEKGTVYSSGGDTIEFQPQIGNEPTDEYWLYTWDLLNRLVKVESWDQDSQTLVIVAEYGYDINNLRIYKSVPGEAEYHYVFDQMGNRLEEHITDLTNGDTFSSYYIFRNGRHVAKRDDSGDVFFYSTDHLGSTVLVTNHLGQDVWRGDTSPFGDSVSGSGELSDSERLKYTGKDYDEDIGLYYFNARWYDADTARFVSEDPARFGSNWYRYASHNPLKYTDPTGLHDWYDSGGDSQSGPSYEYTDSKGTTVDRGEAEAAASAQNSIMDLVRRIKSINDEDISGWPAGLTKGISGIREQLINQLTEELHDYAMAGYSFEFIETNSSIMIQRAEFGDTYSTPILDDNGNLAAHYQNPDGISYDALLDFQFMGVSLFSAPAVSTPTGELDKIDGNAGTIYIPEGTYPGKLMIGHNTYMKDTVNNPDGLFIWIQMPDPRADAGSTFVYIHNSFQPISPLGKACAILYGPNFRALTDRMRYVGFDFTGVKFGNEAVGVRHSINVTMSGRPTNSQSLGDTATFTN